MPAVINLVTTFAMLIHAIVGCCAHHGHEAGCETHSQGEVAHQHDEHAHNHLSAHHSHDAGCGHHGEDSAELCLVHGHSTFCTDAKCSFVKTALPTFSHAPAVSVPYVAVDFNAIEACQHALAMRALPFSSVKLRDSVVAVCAQLQVWAI